MCHCSFDFSRATAMTQSRAFCTLQPLMFMGSMHVYIGFPKTGLPQDSLMGCFFCSVLCCDHQLTQLVDSHEGMLFEVQVRQRPLNERCQWNSSHIREGASEAVLKICWGQCAQAGTIPAICSKHLLEHSMCIFSLSWQAARTAAPKTRSSSVFVNDNQWHNTVGSPQKSRADELTHFAKSYWWSLSLDKTAPTLQIAL